MFYAGARRPSTFGTSARPPAPIPTTGGAEMDPRPGRTGDEPRTVHHSLDEVGGKVAVGIVHPSFSSPEAMQNG